MEHTPSELPDDQIDSRSRQLTREQMEKFCAAIGKQMQLRAQRSQPSTTRSLQAKPRQQDGGTLHMRRLKQRRGY